MILPFARIIAVALTAGLALSACSGSSSAAPQGVTDPFSISFLSPAASGTLVADNTTQIQFLSNRAVSGAPHLAGSDGSALDGGGLTLSASTCQIPAGGSVNQCVYTSAIAGLHAATTYVVSFPTLQITPLVATDLTSESSVVLGSFTTQ